MLKVSNSLKHCIINRLWDFILFFFNSQWLCKRHLGRPPAPETDQSLKPCRPDCCWPGCSSQPGPGGRNRDPTDTSCRQRCLGGSRPVEWCWTDHRVSVRTQIFRHHGNTTSGPISFLVLISHVSFIVPCPGFPSFPIIPCVLVSQYWSWLSGFWHLACLYADSCYRYS